MLIELHSTKVAQLACDQGLEREQALNWWVVCFLKKHEIILAKVKSRNARYLKREIQRFGLRFQTT